MEKVDLIEKIFEAFANSSDNRYVFLCDVQKDYSRWSKKAVERFGLPSEYMEGAGDIWLDKIHPDDRAAYSRSIEALFSGNTKTHDLLYRAKDKDGNYVPCMCKGYMIKDDEGNNLIFAGSIEDYGVAKDIDPNTGLYSKTKLLSVLKGLREDSLKYSLLVFKICEIDEINNVYGYEYGNFLIRVMANQALKYLDVCDVFYLGGARFAMVSVDEKTAGLKKIYAELNDFARKDVIVENSHVTLVLAGACTDVNNSRSEVSAVYSNAIMALNESMEDNYGQLVVFNVTRRGYRFERIAIVNALRNSIVENYKGFYLRYQPVVDAKTEKIVGVETLVRWNMLPYGEVSPRDFIEWLENDPLFYDLGLWIFRTALKDFKEKVLPVIDKVKVSVNLSYSQLKRKEFRTDLENIIKELDFPTDHMVIELTERCRLLENTFLSSEINFMKNMGIEVVLDDFGRSFASIGNIIRLPIDGVKIDKAFLDSLKDSEKARTIIRSIINSLREVGIHSTVEGVEERRIADLVTSYGATYLQGYMFAEPLTIDELLEDPLMNRK